MFYFYSLAFGSDIEWNAFMLNTHLTHGVAELLGYPKDITTSIQPHF